jgi:hypothetical protein
VHSHAFKFLLPRRRQPRLVQYPCDFHAHPPAPGCCFQSCDPHSGPFARLRQLDSFCCSRNHLGRRPPLRLASSCLSPQRRTCLSSSSLECFPISHCAHLSSRAGARASSLGCFIFTVLWLSSLAYPARRVSIGGKLSLIVTLTEFNPLVIFHYTCFGKRLCLGVSFSSQFSPSHSPHYVSPPVPSLPRLSFSCRKDIKVATS